MKVFHHLLYEYQKGLRDLCLFTCPKEYLNRVKSALDYQDIKYFVSPVGEDKINTFFGIEDCLEIIRQFSSEDLNRLTPEEDFMLGMMLGYAKAQQYHRFLKQKMVPV